MCPGSLTNSDYHYVNGGHDILIIGFSYFYGTNAGVFGSDLNYTHDRTSDWGSHALNNYHLSNDGSSISNYVCMFGGEDVYGGTVECGIFNDDTNHPTHGNAACGSPTDIKRFSSTYQVISSQLH